MAIETDTDLRGDVRQKECLIHGFLHYQSDPRNQRERAMHP